MCIPQTRAPSYISPWYQRRCMLYSVKFTNYIPNLVPITHLQTLCKNLYLKP